MKISLDNIGKKFRRDWIFRRITTEIGPGQRWSVLGPNGSGKSTLLRVLSGHLTPSKGSIIFHTGGKNLDKGAVYQHVSIAAPYMELIEEFSLAELVAFHHRFKPFIAGMGPDSVVDLLQFRSFVAQQQIREFSSGMKQRVKLALALCSDARLILLDEPTTNLDRQGVEWYLDLITRFAGDRSLIVASNVPEDYQFCTHSLDIRNYK